jgi:integrase
MARQERILSARGAAAISTPGRHSDGGCLYLLVGNGPRSSAGSAEKLRSSDKVLSKVAFGSSRKSWVYMFAYQGRQCEMGLGPFPQVTLAEARELRDKWRKVLRFGHNPIEARRAGTAVGKTFGQCANEFIQSKRPEWRSAVHASQWRTTLETYAASLYPMPVDQVGTEAVLAVLKPVWQRTPETASRLRGRIENVLDAARARGLIPQTQANPARWKGHLAHLLPKRQQLSRGHHAATPYRQVPQFIGRLREVSSIAARGLEFLIHTACRAGEALGARWNEIDIENQVWIIPAHRMKSGKEHRIPLSRRAIAILEEMSGIRSIQGTDDFVFPGRRYGSPLSRSSMASLLARLEVQGTVHGFRSAFRDWCGNETSFPRELAEQALAHSTGNAVEAPYRRSDALEKRRQLMEAWEEYLDE